MKPKLSYILFCTLTSLTCTKSILAQVNEKRSLELTVGDAVPAFKIEKWIKGGGFNQLEKGKVYLVDLWATWCVPCIAGMPHLSGLQAKYKTKGLEVIGITSEDKYGNSVENVQNFIRKKDSMMNYNLAWVPISIKDSNQGIWLHPWMQMAGLGNLPTAFLIDRSGKVAFIGEPLSIDSILNAVINDRHNINTLKKDYTDAIRAEEILSKFNASLKANKVDDAIQYGNQILLNFNYVKPNTYLVMAWQVSHIKGEIDPNLLQIGYEAIIRGVKLTNFESPGFLDVLASIHAAKKDYFNAVIAEKLAVSLSEGGMKENQTKNLQNYLSLVFKTDK